MSQSSPATVFFRALVMLVCLIAIPAAAIFGNSFPDVLRSLLAGKWPPTAESEACCASEAPRFEPLPMTQAVMTTPPQPLFPQGQPAGLAPIPPAGAMPSTCPMPTGVSPVSYETAVPAVVANEQPDSYTPTMAAVWPTDSALPGEHDAVRPADSADRSFSPAAVGGFPGTAAALSNGALPSGAVRPPARNAADGVDQFTYIQQRLRSLGATYYLLESWGATYRFHCRVAVGGNPNYTHHFEETNADPLRAMATVLRQVETWVATR